MCTSDTEIDYSSIRFLFSPSLLSNAFSKLPVLATSIKFHPHLAGGKKMNTMRVRLNSPRRKAWLVIMTVANPCTSSSFSIFIQITSQGRELSVIASCFFPINILFNFCFFLCKRGELKLLLLGSLFLAWQLFE